MKVVQNLCGVWEEPVSNSNEVRGFTQEKVFFHEFAAVFHNSGDKAVGYELLTLGLLDYLGQIGDLVVDRPTLFHQVRNLFIRIHDRGVVAIQ